MPIEPVQPRVESPRAVYNFRLDDGTELVPGTRFRLQGERGIFRFIKAVVPEGNRAWIDCFGGTEGRQQSRSVWPERIRPIRSKTRARA